jgi:hypothetical protein
VSKGAAAVDNILSFQLVGLIPRKYICWPASCSFFIIIPAGFVGMGPYREQPFAGRELIGVLSWAYLQKLFLTVYFSGAVGLALKQRDTTRENNMIDKEVKNQLKMLQKQIALNGDELGVLKREQRAAMDALHLDVETLRRCLFRLYPELKECFSAIRAETAQEVDPERL